MTVKELIERLQAYDPELVVTVAGHGARTGYFVDARMVEETNLSFSEDKRTPYFGLEAFEFGEKRAVRVLKISG